MILSKRVQSLKPSPTLALAAKAKELQAEGHDVISLSVGEPDWDSFSVAKAAGVKAIEDGFSKYTPASGIPELRKAIAQRVSAETGTNFAADEVTVSTGGKFVIFSALQALLDPGDEVIIPAPYWVSYPTMVELAEGVPQIALCEETSEFKLTPELLLKSITPKTKLLILNSPSNPTGMMYSKKELEALAQVLKDHPQVLILSDDIYNRLVFEGTVSPHILQVAPELKDRTVIVNGVAKSYSMTGWRVGWALGPATLIKAMTNYQSQSVSCAASISQRASLSAILEGEKELGEAVKELKVRRDFITEEFNKIPGMSVVAPDGAFYIWPNIKSFIGKTLNGVKIENSSDFSKALLEKEKVAVVPGVEFGLEGYIRVSYALSKDRMSEAITRITRFLT